MMKKIDILDSKLIENNGFIKTSEIVASNIVRVGIIICLVMKYFTKISKFYI